MTKDRDFRVHCGGFSDRKIGAVKYIPKIRYEDVEIKMGL